MLSVVVIPFGTAGEHERCLRALRPQLERVPSEVIVPHDATFPAPNEPPLGVRFLACGERCTPSQLRSAGAVESRGDVVAFLETHCVPDAQWCASLLAAHESPYEAVGGPIEKAMPPGRQHDSALNWSVYLSDFGRYMLPAESGKVTSLSDCNVSYKRSALESMRALWRSEFHENVVNDALRAAGATLWFEPGMVVRESRDLTMRDALRDRFAFGRLYGSTRVRGRSFLHRAAMAGAAILLPPVLVGRVFGTAWSRRRHVGQVARSSAHLLALSAVWVAGEIVGYITGEPGHSLRPEKGT